MDNTDNFPPGAIITSKNNSKRCYTCSCYSEKIGDAKDYPNEYSYGKCYRDSTYSLPIRDYYMVDSLMTCDKWEFDFALLNDYIDWRFFVNLKNKDNIRDFLKKRNSNVTHLCIMIPAIIASIFDQGIITFSIFNDDELKEIIKIDIETSHDIKELSILEDNLFKILGENKLFKKALEYVTICCK